MTTTFTLLGTVSHGTGRPEHLIPAFLDALKYFDEAKASEILAQVPTEAFDDQDHGYWASEEAQWLVDELFDELEHMAPEYVYFSAHPGDGSDFGFWIDYDAIQEAVVNGEAIFADEIPKDEPQDDITIVFVGNENEVSSMWQYYDGQWHEVWGV